MPTPTLTVPVLIIGAGPAGSSLACFLASHSITGLMISTSRGPARTPRAHITNAAALECLRDLDDGELEAKALRLASSGECMQHTRWCESMNGREYVRNWSWGWDPRRRGEYVGASPCRHVDLPQTELEPCLLGWCGGRGWRVRWEWEFLGFEEDVDGDGVVVRARDKALDREAEIRAQYVFGADGARSRVVEQLGLPLLKNPGGGPALNILVRADLSHLVKHRMGNLHWIFQAEKEAPSWCWITLLRMVKPWTEWMIIAILKPGDKLPDLPSVEEVVKHTSENIIGDPNIPVEVLDMSVWNINDVVAERYSSGSGRVHALGDAVHRHPPFNGLGSNTCIQDAFNLAWKVAYTLKGWAGPGLLESYSAERQPVGAGVVKRANEGFKAHWAVWEAFGLLGESVEERVKAMEELGKDSEEGRRRRERLERAVKGTESEFHALGIEFNQTYVSSAVVEEEGMKGEEGMSDKQRIRDNPDPILYHVRSTVPGRRLPHVWLSKAVPDGLVSTIDIAGHGIFTLFTGIGGVDSWNGAAAAVKADLGVEVRVVGIGWGCEFEDVYFGWREIRAVGETGCVLVRPDRFVGWRCGDNDGVGRLLDVMKTILGRDT